MLIGFRRGAIQRLRKILKFLIVLPGKEPPNSWGGIKAAAKKAGAKFPEVVAAQWALESAWGSHTSGYNNFFGIKAAEGEPYTLCTTWEHYDGKDVTIEAKFKDFDSVQDCVNDLVEKWYLDYKGPIKGSTAQRPWRSVASCWLLKATLLTHTMLLSSWASSQTNNERSNNEDHL